MRPPFTPTVPPTRPTPARGLPGGAAGLPDERGAEDPRAGPQDRPRTWRLAALGFGVWTLLGLCQGAQWYFFPDREDGPGSWPRTLGLGLGLWYALGLLWLLFSPLARRFPLGAGHWPARLALHAAACVAFAAAKMVLDYPVVMLFYFPTPVWLAFPQYAEVALSAVPLRYAVFYWALLGLSHALAYYGKYRERELRAAQLEAGLARAQLQLLKTQLHPHFLFNTLNAISALLHADVEAADRMLARLGELLRLALENFAVQEAPLARELEALRSYLAIEQARLGPRLRVCFDVAPGTAAARVPTFLLQPLVENAIRHGIAPRTAPGHVGVRAWREGDRLHLEVRDDGPGFPARPAPTSGVGLANTRARLFHLYGAEQRLETGNHPRGGGLVKVTLPLREHPGAPDDEGVP